MKTLLIYLAGVATPFLVAFSFIIIGDVADWRDRRRYQRAWDKFSAEFDALPEDQLREHRVTWNEQSYHYGQFHDDRCRYFNMRWQYGHTTEI